MDHRFCLVLLLFISVTSCQPPDLPEEFAARVGNAYLFDSDMESSLINLDQTEARRRLIDQWIHQELLYQEALKQGLQERGDIKERLKQSSREILIEGIIRDYYNRAEVEVTPSEISTYYEENKEYMHFLGSFVKVRYLSSSRQDSLEFVLELLEREPITDSLFTVLVERFSSSVASELKILQNYYPEATLFQNQPVLHQYVRTARVGSPPQILTADSIYHLLQVVDRSALDAIPELPWVQGFIREQLLIQYRNRIYLQNVHTLRAQAEFREDIEIK